MKSKRSQYVILAVILVVIGTVWWQRQALEDWERLQGYVAPAAVTQLASQDTMTPEATHLFYVNRPDITDGSAFTKNCPAGGEKTIVLGCYLSPDEGIYIYSVSDSRLNGVEQVTAAHEMLHAAYRRLSKSERAKVNAMLLDYYDHDLTDQRVKDTIAAYTKSEPNDVVNEMHSVFGTEVANLPSPLEKYYKQYFTDRSKVTAYAASYQAEFTNRESEVKQYDAQLASLKPQIDANKAALADQKASLSKQYASLQTEAVSNPSQYRQDALAYNQAVDSHNQLVAATNNLVNQYNGIVVQRNAVALEEQQLGQELTAGTATN